MNSTQQIKLTQYMTNQKATLSSIGRSIASLNNDLAAAISHQAYARSNPDATVDAELLALINIGVDELLTQYNEVDAKRIDVLAVKDGTMTVDELIAKYNIDLAAYSNALI
ncbi:hypothetical protein [Pseudoalteromonas sp.]|uniref:hypothetical protein n=1 Tax=Pseudoalteromonas sp. TaxID=53249 RepID=UPI003561BF0B